MPDKADDWRVDGWWIDICLARLIDGWSTERLIE